MAAFLYFLPGRPRVDQIKTTGEFGVADLKALLHDGQFSEFYVDRGPGGHSGIMLACIPWPTARDELTNEPGDEPRNEYSADRQSWVPAHEFGQPEPAYWIGWEKDRPPRPVDLARPGMIDGHAVQLADGRKWLVPEVGPRLTRLPRGFEFINGEMRIVVVERFRRAFEESQYWANLNHCGGEWNWLEAMAWAASVLGINYRVGVRECATNVLGMMTTEVFWRPFVAAATGVLTLEAEDAAKSEAATP